MYLEYVYVDRIYYNLMLDRFQLIYYRTIITHLLFRLKSSEVMYLRKLKQKKNI